MTFSTEEKVKMFDEIASHFYERNFGSLSKSDMELLMFDFYIKKLTADNTFADGTIDYNKCSDYRISKELGITQQRVRNLKVKNQLVHPVEFDWTKAFLTLVVNARYDNGTHRMFMNIPDPNLYNEIANFIEEQGAYIDKQLNNKLLSIRVEYFIELMIAAEPEQTQKQIIKILKSNKSLYAKSDKVFDEKHIGKSLIETGADITAILSSLLTIMPAANDIILKIKDLVTKFS